jgi:hypothetical protein
MDARDRVAVYWLRPWQVLALDLYFLALSTIVATIGAISKQDCLS